MPTLATHMPVYKDYRGTIRVAMPMATKPDGTQVGWIKRSDYVTYGYRADLVVPMED